MYLSRVVSTTHMYSCIRTKFTRIITINKPKINQLIKQKNKPINTKKLGVSFCLEVVKKLPLFVKVQLCCVVEVRKEVELQLTRTQLRPRQNNNKVKQKIVN